MINYNAGELLDELRPGIELLLAEAVPMFRPDGISAAPSQSLRARQVIGMIDDSFRTFDFDKRMRLIQIKIQLEQFLAVHTTVTMLERRARDKRALMDEYEWDESQINDK